jgi:2-methylisocitrate lyase-like PEP mutase family enzyme
MSRSAALRARLAEPRLLVAPGAVDALTARVIQDAGFEAVYVTGAGYANAGFGVPDLGLTTLTEIVTHVGRIADAVAVPVIADADTGYGGPLNVVRTVRELERAGAAAIQLEDQVSPKRCGHFAGTEVIPTIEMVRKIEAAVYARRDPDLVLIARTDARATEGFAAAVERGRAYAAAGADVVFVEAPRTVEELRQLPGLIDAPLLVNLVEGGKTPLLPAAELEALGFRIALFANTALRVALKAVQEAMHILRAEGSSQSLLDRMVTWDERQRLVGLPEYTALGERFAVARSDAAAAPANAAPAPAEARGRSAP